MKKRLVSLFLLLCMMLSVFAMASCSRDKNKGGETAEATTAATTDKWEVLAPRVKALPVDDRMLKIECSKLVTAEKGSNNQLYLEGDDGDDKVTAIEQMVRTRNEKAQSLLGVSVEFTYWDYGYGKQWKQIDLVVKGGAIDAPDLFVNMLYDMNMEVMNGGFKDVYSIPGSFFDFSADGWLEDWMMNMSLTGDRGYILGGDFFLDIFRSMSLLPFNVTMMNAKASKLAPAIIGTGAALGEGEKLSYRFFDLVEGGNWTWAVLHQLCEAAWVDATKDGNGNMGQTDIYDTLGIIADRYGGINASSFLYSSGVKLTETYKITDASSQYNGKNWIKYPDDSSELNAIFDAVKAVFEGNGALSTSYTFKGATPDQPGSTYHHIKFAQGELLFAGACLLGALEDDVFQKDMKDSYSVVPFPKVDASKEYNTIIINQGDVGGINVRTAPNKVRALTAFLQYCTENSLAIREQFLQTVTKYDTMDYDQGTDRMLDLVYDTIRYDRDKAIDDIVGVMDEEELRNSRWHSLLKDDEFCGGSSYISAEFKSVRQSKQDKLDKILTTWYTLPTSGTVAGSGS